MPWQWPWRRTLDRALWQIGDSPTMQSWAGESVTADKALRLSTVFGCVRLLADSVSTLPLHVYRDDERDPLPTPRLLQRPSADHPEPSDWLWAIMASLLLRGNAWGAISDRTGAGLLPSQVDLLDPDQVTTSFEDGQWVIRVGGEEVDRSDLFHVKAFPWAGKLEGLSPISYAREAIGLGRAAERYGATFFRDASDPRGLLTRDQDITREHARMTKELWKYAFTNKREIAVLGRGVKFQPISINPEESQFLGTIKANVDTICRFYGIPSEMMNGPTAGHEAYTSPEMRGADFLTFTLRPWLLRIERAVSGLLPRNQAAKFNTGGFLRATLREQYEALNIGVAGGFVTPNEAREKLDLPAIPGLDRPPVAEGGAVA